MVEPQFILLIHDWGQATGRLSVFDRKIMLDTALALTRDGRIDAVREQHLQRILRVAAANGCGPAETFTGKTDG